MSEDDRAKEAAELEAKAAAAEGDLEEMLIQLDMLAERRRKDPDIEARYETLRDDCAAIILKEGPRFYLDARGHKRYAYAIQPEPVEINVALLISMNKAGEISDQLLEKLAPRKADNDAFRRAAATKRLSPAQVQRVARITKGTAHVRFSDPYDPS